MATITEPVVICDQCGERLTGNYLKTEAIPNEGCSTIYYTGTKNKVYDVDNFDFCDMDCLMEHIQGDIL